MAPGSSLNGVYLGVFLVSLATLSYEVVLTRVFSVVYWYHMAFVALSSAMFGLTLGALAVYLRPGFFSEEKTQVHLAVFSILFACALLINPFYYPLMPSALGFSRADFTSTAVTYAVISAPFIFSGVVLCLALTRFPKRIGTIYGFDLTGAAIGCLTALAVLNLFDGPSAVLALSSIAGLGALSFSSVPCRRRRLLFLSGILTLVLLSFLLLEAGLLPSNMGTLRLSPLRLGPEKDFLFERWNSFSRVTVEGNMSSEVPVFLTGPSKGFSPPAMRQLWLVIDSKAATPLTGFDGDVGRLGFMRYDVVNVVHYLRPRSRVLVVGSGGGRDVLAALVFNQTSVVAVDVNENVLYAVNGRFGDFTGHLDRLPNVRFVNDDARSFVARDGGRYDIILFSMIDTWAATSTGGFALSEHSLYTTEAWASFLGHLSGRGILSVSWFYNPPNYDPAIKSYFYRMASLAASSLRSSGVLDPEDHIVVVGGSANGIGTLLVSKEPFTREDLDRLDEVASGLGFEVVYSSRNRADRVFSEAASGGGISKGLVGGSLNLGAPSDDQPFFFNIVYPSGALGKTADIPNMQASSILVVFLIVTLSFSFLCFFLPLWLGGPRIGFRENLPFLAYFVFIGLGFILVEMSQIQRLSIFLGHPVYSISAVLFSLLFFAGVGSFSTRLIRPGDRSTPLRVLVLLVVSLAAFWFVSSAIIAAYAGSGAYVRVLVSVLFIAPVGLLMGMAFPFGMVVASERSGGITPWLWGVNGVASVLASVLSVAVSLEYGISYSFWGGVLCYAVALAAYAFVANR